MSSQNEREVLMESLQKEMSSNKLLSQEKVSGMKFDPLGFISSNVCVCVRVCVCVCACVLECV